jgi:ribose 5-phosphate isomerase B
MNIAIGADHGGFVLKNEIAQWLRAKGHDVTDFGTDSATSVDYPDYARPVAAAVAAGKHECGILVCGTGQGMAITANKVHGVRAAACSDTFSARMTREHNNANVLCLGQRVVGVGLALDIVEIWLRTPFSTDERHQRRVDKIADADAARQ